MIRPLASADIPALEALQNGVLGGSLPTRFGGSFFRLFYNTLLADPRFICAGFFWDGRLVGFLSATTDSAAMFESAFRKSRWAFARTVLASIVARPSRLRTLASLLPALRSPQRELGERVRAELLSFGVEPAYRGQSTFFESTGRRVSRELLAFVYDGLRSRGVRRVSAFVRPEEVDSFVNEFYLRADFLLVRRTVRLGIACNWYVRDL
ncbi:MAG TPA: hypothetical protein VFV78_03255 [Vicinamibacterales bacterium]|nr:hypothetical protein [Vicinamibacterales bacterium]